jgi:hypothetical protein
MSSARATHGSRLIRLLITILATGAAISGLMNLTGRPRAIVQHHWEETRFGTEFLSYLADYHVGSRGGDVTAGFDNLTWRRMGSGFMELAGALFLWPSHTASTSSRRCECIGSIILLFMFVQGAMVNWKLGLEYEFLGTSIASFMALITLLHGIASSTFSDSSSTISAHRNKTKKM